jgi:hypothetical protein
METQQMIVLGAGSLLSLLFAYVPKLNSWYEQKDSQTKQLVMLVCLVVVAAGMAGASCAGINLSVSLPVCDQGGLTALVEAFVLATLGNVATYASTKYIGKIA